MLRRVNQLWIICFSIRFRNYSKVESKKKLFTRRRRKKYDNVEKFALSRLPFGWNTKYVRKTDEKFFIPKQENHVRVAARSKYEIHPRIQYNYNMLLNYTIFLQIFILPAWLNRIFLCSRAFFLVLAFFFLLFFSSVCCVSIGPINRYQLRRVPFLPSVRAEWLSNVGFFSSCVLFIDMVALFGERWSDVSQNIIRGVEVLTW